MLLLAILPLVSATYTNLYFNASNGCPDLGIICNAPSSMCAYDSVNDKYYCCSGSSYDICRAYAPTCGGSDGGPNSVQQNCTSGSSSWCCLSEAQGERCTTRTGQVNVCVSTQDNPIAAVPDTLMNDTFSSLSSANPSATTYSVDVSSLAARATSSSSSSSPATTTGEATQTSSTAGPSSTTAIPERGSTPTGAIAGGVVGGVAALLIIAGAIWFFLRKRKNTKLLHNNSSSPTTAEKHDDPFGDSGVQTPAPQYQVAEMAGMRERGELPASPGGEGKRLVRREVHEMGADRDDGVRELPG